MKKILMIDGTSSETNGDNGQGVSVHDDGDSAISVRILLFFNFIPGSQMEFTL